jgi:signal-transduction protein with cAMP-binding, CBS, and nucleotidyltransferase domain
VGDNEEEETEREVAPLLVKDVMITQVMTVDVGVTVREAAKKMSESGIGSLITVENGRTVGILTEGDMLKRVIAEGKDPVKTTVKEIMSSPLVVAGPNMDLGVAVELMFQKKIKQLPVVQDNKLIGLITLTDIARGAPEMLKIIKELAAKQAVPRNIQKVIDRYIV